MGRRAGGARKNVQSAGASGPPSTREVAPPPTLPDAAAPPWEHCVPGSGAKTRPTSRPREPRPRETQRRRTPPQQETSVSHQAKLSEETDRIRVALGGSGWTASHSAATYRHLRMKPLAKGQQARGRELGGNGARAGYVVSRTGGGRNIAAVPLLQVVVTYSSHKSEIKGRSPRRSAA